MDVERGNGVFVDQRSLSSRRQRMMLYIGIVALVVLLVGGRLMAGPLMDSDGVEVDPVTFEPLQPIVLLKDKATTYPVPANAMRIGIIADMDRASHYGDVWRSVLKSGLLVRDDADRYSISWEQDENLSTKMNEGGRGFELSELIYWNNMVLTCDDRTGIIYELIKGIAVPRFILMDGDGDSNKGFKCEWMAVKDNKLYVGSMGKEWTTPEGVIVNTNPQFVKVIDTEGTIEHHDWHETYVKFKQAAGIPTDGYILYESANWNEADSRWYFLPRRVSKEKYDDVADESRGSNLMIISNADFSDVSTRLVGPLIPTHGFSSFKFVPGRPDEILAIKSEEFGENINSFITVFKTDGTVLMPETLVPGIKFEGVEFLPY